MKTCSTTSPAGVPISVLQSFKAPPQQLRDDPDLYRERIQATASSVLGLMGIEVDREFARNGWVNIVGGCCGTTPAHIRAPGSPARW